MAKIGGYEYPTLDPEEAVDIAETLVKKFNGEPSNPEAFAQSIGHNTTNSGAYITKIADMRRYGLIESRGLKATDLANRISIPEDEKEKKNAYLEMFKNIDLLHDLYENLDGNKPVGDLWVILSDITGAPRNESKEVEDDISKLYSKMLKYETDETETLGKVPPPTKSAKVGGSGKEEKLSDIFVKFGEEELKLDKNMTNIDLAIQFLKNKKQELVQNKSDNKSN